MTERISRKEDTQITNFFNGYFSIPYLAILSKCMNELSVRITGQVGDLYD